MDHKDMESKLEQTNTQDTSTTDLPPYTADPSSSSSSNAKTYLVNYTSWKQTKSEITDAQTNTPLYTIDYHLRKPHLRFRDVSDTNSDPEPFSTAEFNTLGTKLHVTLRSGAEITLKLRRAFSSDYTYTSPSLHTDLKWTSKSGWKNFDYLCLDDKAMPVAKITNEYYANKKLARVEVVEGFGGDQGAVEELVVGGMALAYFMMVGIQGAVAAA